MSAPINLLNFSRPMLEAWLATLGEPSYRAKQILQWIHLYGVTDFDAMTNLSKAFRATLQAQCVVDLPKILKEQISTDGTRKWLMQYPDGNSIETVYIPEPGRGTLCVSSQVGCALNCSFCATARQGFNRNLSIAEIIAQVWVAARALSTLNGQHDKKVTNVVMMGMGEPLLNFDNVVAAMDIMMDDMAYGLSKYRVTLSTSGVVPAMYRLREQSEAALAVSLHAPNDELRNTLVPLNKKYPIAELMEACRAYFADQPKRCVTFEYVMLAGINDSDQHARQLVKILAGIPNKVNLIPFNPFEFCQYQRSDRATIERFRDILQRAGLQTNIRKTRGDDIDAACGQLVGKVHDRTSRSRLMKSQDKRQSEAASMLAEDLNNED